MADEWRYFCMLNPIKPRISQDEEIPFFDPLDMYHKTKIVRKGVINIV